MKQTDVHISQRQVNETPVEFTDLSTLQIVGMVEEAIDSLAAPIPPVRGLKVVVKPNLVRPGLSYGSAVTTDPRVVAALCGVLRDLGAAEVLVGDDPGWGLSSEEAYAAWGQREYIARWGGTLVLFDLLPRFEVEVGTNVLMPVVSLPAPLRDADLFVNVPKMKTHMLTDVSLGIKNLHGMVPDEHRLIFHRGDVEIKLVDILSAREPDLIVVDAIWALEGQAPLYGDIVRDMNSLIIGTNSVAVDTVAASVMGFDPFGLTALREASRRGLGPVSLAKIEITGKSVDSVMRPFKRAVLSSVAVFDHVEVIEGGADPGVLSALRHSLDRLQRERLLEGIKPFTILVGRFHHERMPRLQTCEIWLFGDAAIKARERLPLHHDVHEVPGDAPHIFDFYKAFTELHLRD